MGLPAQAVVMGALFLFSIQAGLAAKPTKFSPPMVGLSAPSTKFTGITRPTAPVNQGANARIAPSAEKLPTPGKNDTNTEHPDPAETGDVMSLLSL